METILLLWTAAPALKTQIVVLTILAQIVLTVWCYGKLSSKRVSAAKSGKVTPDMYKAVGDAEPEEIRVYTRLVANQFEMPVLFYVLLMTGLAINVTSWFTVVLAILYVVLRVVHAREMTGTHNVFRRRKIFIQSARVLLLLILELAVSTVFFFQV
ncbi:MAG: MAPEG family protein [Pseudomonadota bacterium]